MSAVNITNVVVLDNPAAFLDPFQLEISYYELTPLIPQKIPEEDIIGVTVLLLACSYTGQEFVRVGYYVNNDYDDDQLRGEPPAKLLIDRVQRHLGKPRVTKFPINFHPETSAGAGQQPQSTSPESHASEGSKPNPDQ